MSVYWLHYDLLQSSNHLWRFWTFPDGRATTFQVDIDCKPSWTWLCHFAPFIMVIMKLWARVNIVLRTGWKWPKYKYSISGPPEGLWSPAMLYRPGTSQPLGCKVRLWKCFRGSPSVSLFLHPPTFLHVSWFSASLVLSSNSQINASTLPPPDRQSQLAAYCHWVAIVGRPTVCWAPSSPPEAL